MNVIVQPWENYIRISVEPESEKDMAFLPRLTGVLLDLFHTVPPEAVIERKVPLAPDPAGDEIYRSVQEMLKVIDDMIGRGATTEELGRRVRRARDLVALGVGTQSVGVLGMMHLALIVTQWERDGRP